jgi:hypothetical protein
VVKIYEPWPVPVQATCFRDTATLPEIDRWVASLRDQGRIPADVDFTIRKRGDTLFGMLHDHQGDHELTPGAFLVFGHSGLRVLDEHSFFRQYRAA